jgi:hypothetical protein
MRENLEAGFTNEPMMESKMAKKEYTPSKTEALREYEISIRFLSRGCIVRVGCKEIAFSDNEEAITELSKYFNAPYETQKSWRKILD